MLTGLKQLKRETLQDKVYEQLCSLILGGELAPGQSIPVTQVAKALDVSPMPVREAISRLMALGALTVVSGRSIGVPLLQLEELDDLRRVRSAIEPVAVTWAVERADVNFVRDIGRLLQTLERSEQEGKTRDFIRANHAFHFAFYRQAGSPTMLEIIGNIWLRINPQFYLLERHGHYRISNCQHRDMHDALVVRDPQAAADALRADIDSAYAVMRDMQSATADS